MPPGRAARRAGSRRRMARAGPVRRRWTPGAMAGRLEPSAPGRLAGRPDAARAGRRTARRRDRGPAPRAHARVGLPGPAARRGLRDLAAHDRRRLPDRPRPRRLDGERGALAPRDLARRARLRRRDRVHVGQRHRGPPRAARRAASTRSTPTTSTTRRSGARASTASTTTSCGTADYDAMEDFTRGFFEHLAATWPGPAISGVRFMRELGRWLDAQGLGRRRSPRPARATACRSSCRRRRTARWPRAIARRARKGPVVDFFRDYEIALAMMNRFMAPGPGTAAIFLGGGVPEGLHPDHGDERVHAARRGGVPARRGDPDHHRQPGLRRAGGRRASTPRPSRGARRRPTATTSWSSPT